MFILLIKKTWACSLVTLWSLGHSLIVGWLTGPLLYLKISICSAICVCVFFNYRFLVECLYWCSPKLARKCSVKCSQVSLRRPEWRQCRICKKCRLFFSRFLCSLCKTVTKYLASFSFPQLKLLYSLCVCCSVWITLCNKYLMFNSRRLCGKQATVFQPAHILQPAKACIRNTMCGKKFWNDRQKNVLWET